MGKPIPKMERPEYTDVINTLTTHRFTAKELSLLNEKDILDLFSIANGANRLTISLKERKELGFLFDSSGQTEFHLFKVKWSLYKPAFPWIDSPVKAGKKGERWTNTERSIQFFKDWLTNEVDHFFRVKVLPDPLERFKQQADFKFEFTEKNKGDLLTNSERTEFKESINEFRRLLEQHFQVSEDVKKHIHAELKYLSEKVDTLNRRDLYAVGWKIIYDLGISVTGNVIVAVGQALIHIEMNPLFWQVVKQAFSYVLRLGN